MGGMGTVVSVQRNLVMYRSVLLKEKMLKGRIREYIFSLVQAKISHISWESLFENVVGVAYAGIVCSRLVWVVR